MSSSSQGTGTQQAEEASDASLQAESSGSPFGASLEPVLRKACSGRLSGVSWFRTEWQRGGALTGYATYDDAGRPTPVVVKLPVPPMERRWLERLQGRSVAPHLLAHGEALNGYDMSWLVMECLPHGPLGTAWAGEGFDLLIEAAGRFYQSSSDYEVTGDPPQRDWDAIHDRARSVAQGKKLPHEQRWSKALKKAKAKLKDWVTRWNDRPVADWCHGDLHLANAMSREPAPRGPAVLLDFAMVHRGNWIEDAVYLEYLHWSRRHQLHGRRIARQMAQERKKLGLPVDSDWAEWAALRRTLLALSTPAMLMQMGEPQHLIAALEVLEEGVG